MQQCCYVPVQCITGVDDFHVVLYVNCCVFQQKVLKIKHEWCEKESEKEEKEKKRDSTENCKK